MPRDCTHLLRALQAPHPTAQPGVVAAPAAALTACTTLRPPAQVSPATPTSWQAPLPHDGQLQQLTNWWARTNDPVLVGLIESAQRISPSLAQARSRVEQARATQTTARAALLPTLDAQASASRGVTPPVTTPATTAQAGLQAGGDRPVRRQPGHARCRHRAPRRGPGPGHEARVSVAAEVALQVSSLRTCLQQLDVAERDAQSRAATARLTQDSQRAGFTAPATAALASASAAEATARAPSSACSAMWTSRPWWR